MNTLDGKSVSLNQWSGQALLIVNVASQCGLTPQYAGLEKLHERLAPRGFSVLGFPCNQFAGQEPGSAGQIAQFCSTTYGVTFPMFEKIDVNGAQQHGLYAQLTELADATGQAGDVQWNFEKFLVNGQGEPVARFRPATEPADPDLLAAIDKQLR